MILRQRVRAIVTAESIPKLPPHVRLRFDAVRGRWVLLAPEKLFWPDAVSLDILQLIDGQNSIGQIASKLAKNYAASPSTIEQDIVEFVQEWTDNLLLKI